MGFKVGDKVRCVDAKPRYGAFTSGLTKDRIYTVTNVANSDSIGVDGGVAFDANRFELVKAPAPKFKAGDKVRCISDRFEYAKRGEVYTVRSVSKDGRMALTGGSIPDVNSWDYPGHVYSTDSFELANLELEVGAFVTIGGGVDGWEVMYKGFASSDVKRGETWASVQNKYLTAVKAAPQPVDYYVNAKGEKPQAGDVLRVKDNNTTVLITQDVRGRRPLNFVNQYGHSDEVTVPGYYLTIGSDWERTLIVRDGKPYVSQ